MQSSEHNTLKSIAGALSIANLAAVTNLWIILFDFQNETLFYCEFSFSRFMPIIVIDIFYT
jgi:hypothetical protein